MLSATPTTLTLYKGDQLRYEVLSLYQLNRH